MMMKIPNQTKGDKTCFCLPLFMEEKGITTLQSMSHAKLIQLQVFNIIMFLKF